MYKLFHVNPFKAVNNVSVILHNGRVIMEMEKYRRERVATLIDNRLIHLLILSRFLFRVPIKCSAWHSVSYRENGSKRLLFLKAFVIWFRSHGFLACLFTKPDLASLDLHPHVAVVLRVVSAPAASITWSTSPPQRWGGVGAGGGRQGGQRHHVETPRWSSCPSLRTAMWPSVVMAEEQAGPLSWGSPVCLSTLVPLTRNLTDC